jgi:hypothetical protein
MSDDLNPFEGEILPNSLPIPYVTPYTNKTPTIGPLLVTAIAAGAFLMVEWGTLRWIDHAPPAIWIGSTVIAICVLSVIANKDWLNFKNRRYFPISLSGLVVVWIGIVAFGYYLDAASPHSVDPVVSNLQSQLASALRERDTAILERDTARRDHNVTPTNPSPPPPPTRVWTHNLIQ